MSDEVRDARARLVEAGTDAVYQPDELLDLWCSPEHRDDLARVLDPEAVAKVERLQRVRDAAEAFDREWERGDTIGQGIAAVNAFRDTLARLDKENQ